MEDEDDNKITDSFIFRSKGSYNMPPFKIRMMYMSQAQL